MNMDSSPDIRVNLFVIGVNKAGSSWLYYLLDDHPDISMSEVKELYYFDSDYPENLERYHRYFDTDDSVEYLGEATPTYYRNPETAENIYEYNPDAKILVILRDPIKRLQSQYYFHKQLNIIPEDWSLREAIHKDGSLIADSHYEQTLPVYEEVFGDDQVFILSLEEVRTDPEQVWNEIQGFLGVSPVSLPELRNQSENPTGSKWFRMVYRITIRPIKKFAPGLYEWLLGWQVMRWLKIMLLRVLGTAKKQPTPPELRRELEREFAPTYRYLKRLGLHGSVRNTEDTADHRV